MSETRCAFGFPKGATSKFGSEKNPIDGIWEHMKDKCGDISKDQFFGFEAIPDIAMENNRFGSIAACHLNMLSLV